MEASASLPALRRLRPFCPAAIGGHGWLGCRRTQKGLLRNIGQKDRWSIKGKIQLSK
ncbi:MAG: hypothetical protein ACOYMG_11900 [Candidatus Methylumidiphilus sp.]